VSAGLFALLVSTIASAECNASRCDAVYVEELYPEAAGGARVRTSGNESLANCTADSGVYLRLDAGPGFQTIYATLLAAQVSDNKVSICIVEGSNPCRIAYVTLNSTVW
jgi:hypothetical protein